MSKAVQIIYAKKVLESFYGKTIGCQPHPDSFDLRFKAQVGSDSVSDSS
jgi:hypothetical protein